MNFLGRKKIIHDYFYTLTKHGMGLRQNILPESTTEYLDAL